MQKKEYTLDLEGKIITASFTDLVDQANGSVMLSCENTVVLATAVMSKSGKHNPGYFDLQVSYEERFYAGGEILGARYTRREGRPSTRAVLSSRIIDRTLRPLFAHHIRNAVQIVITVLSVGTYDPTLLGINAASLAIATSNIPWAGPVAGVQLLAVSGEEYHINTTRDKGTVYETDLVVCGRGGTINMIEAATYEVSEDHAIKALQTAEPLILQLEEWQKGIVAEIGKEKITIETPTCPQDVLDLFDKTMRPKMLVELFGEDSKTRIDTLEGEWDGIVDEMYPGDDEDTHNTRRLGAYHFHTMVDEILHEAALTENKRADLRAMDEVRDLYAQVGGISPLLHGTGIFYRGGTHMLTVLTLAGPDKKLLEEGMEVQEEKDFFHHYNFPPYSAGETGRIGGANRRAIGHGMLAEKALAPVLPNKTDFPYTMRLVSESMASNGSTSQAAICGMSLALMDGGVPITRPVAGIAMGVMTDPKDPSNFKVLTDIQGPEDHHGDMDFKVAGTREGITAIQMDVKVSGIVLAALIEGLEQAKTARLHILDAIESEIASPRTEISQHAPKIESIKIDPEYIGRIIGKGGETIHKLQDETQTTITIEEDGTIFVTGLADAPSKAVAAISAITKEWKPGDKVVGTVKKILDDVGAIVTLSAYTDGMVHISEIANFRVNAVADFLTEGQEIPVTVMKVDKAKGRIGLSIKADNPDFIKPKQ